MENKSQWIWYPGDFEMMLGIRLHSSRYERKAQINTEWRMETAYPNIRFFKKFTIKNRTRVTINCCGKSTVKIDQLFYKTDYEGYIDFEPGEHSLDVFVFNKEGLPCLYIDNEQLRTDSTWTVTCGDFDWVQAGCQGFTEIDAPPMDFSLNTTPVAYQSKREAGGGILYDFGKELMAYVCCEQVTGKGLLQIFYGESEREALDTAFCELTDEAEIEGDYKTKIAKAFRYLFVKTENSLCVGDISALYEYLPVKNKGSFKCDSDLINKIYETSVYTLHLNSREFFIDGIKRDRWVWSGDATQSYLLNYYSFFDNDLCKRTMRMLCGKAPMKTHFNTIQEYTLYWFISLYDYYFYTGDLEFLKNMYSNAERIMEYCKRFTDDRGFIMPQKNDWVFIDWAPIDKTGDQSFIQLLYAKALESMSLIAELCGRKEDEISYKNDFVKTYDSFNKAFKSESKGCFLHTNKEKDSETVTRYTNMFAMLLGYLDKTQTEHITQTVLFNDGITPITTPYMKLYELLGLCEAGELDTVMSYMEEYWGGMLNEGATTIWEAYDPNDKGDAHYAMYDRPYGKSLCHAWGAGPILILGKYILGVRPEKPAYKEFSVNPFKGNLKFIEGSVPTPTGDIHVFLDDDLLSVDNRSQGEGTINYKGQTRKIHPKQSVKILI